VRLRVNEHVCCVSKLGRGEAKRVPRHVLAPVVGFYVGCPFCGKVQTIVSVRIDPEGGQTFEETDEGITMHPGHTCTRCGRTYRAERGEIRVVA